MKVIVIGAGLGGLTAAYCFAKSGHIVELFERSHQLNALGGGISIRPGASRIMHDWGLDEDLEKVSEKSSSVTFRDLKSGEISQEDVILDDPKHVNWGTTRKTMVKLLYHKASTTGAHIHFNANVVQVLDDETHAAVVLESGERITGDLVLAADGIKSHARSTILSDIDPHRSLQPIINSTTFYGGQIVATDLSEDPSSMKLTQTRNMTCWLGDGGFVITRYSSRFNRIGFLFASQDETDQRSLWDDKGDIEYVRKIFADSNSELVKTLQLADACDRWRLAEMPNLPRWTSQAGRVILLGDSAHAMHPNAAQGFSMTIEDIGVLNHLLEHFASNSTISMRRIVEIWQAIRKPRVERIKAYSRWNTTHFSSRQLNSSDKTKTQTEDVQNVIPDRDADFQSPAFYKWSLDYDAIYEAERHLRLAKI